MIEQSEKHLQTKFEAIESSIEHKLSKLDSMPTQRGLIITVVSALAIGMGIVIAILSYGNDRFNGGATYVGSTYDQARSARDAAEEMKRVTEEHTKQIGLLLDLLKRPRAP